MGKRKLVDEVGWLAASIADSCIPQFDHPIERLVLPPDEVRAEILKRLKKVPYPYESQSRREGKKSTYEKLQKDCDVEVFLNALLNPLKAWMETPEFPPMHGAMHSPGEPGRQFRAFHRLLARELNRHLLALQELARGYELRPEWIGPYTTRIYNQLINELALLRMYVGESPASDKVALRSAVEQVFEIVTKALNVANIENDSLAYHLTSIFCSSNSNTTGILQPSPDSVRKFLRRTPSKRGRR